MSEAFAAARDLLLQAEADAARIRADADRYRRQRELEAELIVAKARRMLLLAEERAATISAAPPLVLDLDAPPLVRHRDLGPPLALGELDDDDDPIRPGSRRTRSDLDSILATAVTNAINRALPSDR